MIREQNILFLNWGLIEHMKFIWLAMNNFTPYIIENEWWRKKKRLETSIKFVHKHTCTEEEKISRCKNFIFFFFKCGLTRDKQISRLNMIICNECSNLWQYLRHAMFCFANHNMIQNHIWLGDDICVYVDVSVNKMKSTKRVGERGRGSQRRMYPCLS